MFDFIIPFWMWLSQPEVIPAIKTAIIHWYEWRMRNIYIPEGLEGYYANRVKQVDMIFNSNKYERNNSNKKGNKKK